MRRFAVLLLLPLLVGASPAQKGEPRVGVGAAVPKGELRGTLQLLQDGKPSKEGVQQAVVYFTPARPEKLEPLAKPLEMATAKKEFKPHALVLPVGSKVRFPNEDPILHNVFSVSPGNAFDLGLYRQGPGKEKKLDQPGLVRVFCNVHHDMVAYVLVLDTPYFASPGADGTFVLTGLPKGPGRLTVWHEQAEPATFDVQVPAAQPAVTRLEIVRPRVPPHLNKIGRSYSQRDRYNQ